ncbi:EmrB/QacA subfamily drug resistance transporter [Scopulibacillus daqui]|uniref:EmrB/QacA subfamily drug resistance transporter n=1 Tax=Scopulibacillus daqui TaxID=1469162 RepID=A0ABS2Q0U5_9BACL|nr:DHA2 family efflux MFS transporter permease subunit [Scopulibacillus daqui]MBM7645920.1 EmrB/QacA subfamily drug resistance transporter [Scopulibacillus daqui]
MEQVQTKQDVNRIPIVAVLILGGFVALLNQTLLNTAIPKIMDDLEISANTSQWLSTGFMLVNGIMIPISALLINRFTTRQLFFTAMSFFALGTLIAAFAQNFTFLLTGRLVQACGAGIMMPLMQTVMFMIFPKEKRGAAMGMVGLAIAFAPAIGPTLSGWIVEHYSWRLLFYVILPFVLIDIIIGIFVLKNVTKQTFPKIDFISIILSSIGFGGFLYGFSSAGNNGWDSAEVIMSLIISMVALGLFVWRQLVAEKPMLDFRVFTHGTFAVTTLLTMIVSMAMLSAELLLPLYMQNMRDFTALESGMMLLPGAIVMGITSPIAGRVFDKIGARWLSIIGLTIVAITTFLFTNLDASMSYTYILLIYAVRMFGLAIVMMPVTTAGLNQLPEHLISHGTAMNNTMRTVSGSIGTALLVTIMTNSAQNYHQDMSAFKGMALEEAKHQMAANAMIHGINVAFMVASGIACLGLVVSFFIKQKDVSENKSNV